MIAMWFMFACGAGLIVWGVVGIRRGAIWDSAAAGELIRRDDDPSMFWTAISVIFTLALLAFGVGAIAGLGARPVG